jgi:hypothetical protein
MKWIALVIFILKKPKQLQLTLIPLPLAYIDNAMKPANKIQAASAAILRHLTINNKNPRIISIPIKSIASGEVIKVGKIPKTLIELTNLP